MQIEKRIGREKKRCGYAPFNSAQQAIKLRSLRSLRPSGKLPSATCFIAGPLVAMLCYMYEMNNRCFSVFPSALTLAVARKQRNNDAIECIGVGKSLESVESLLSRA